MPVPVARVDKVNLLSHPAPVNFDELPGPDGFKVQVFMFQNSKPEPVLVTGTVQFLLFEKNVTAEEMSSLEPCLVWTYSGDKLTQHAVRSRIGWGYAANLRWGTHKPTSTSVSLAALYRSPDGRAVYSEPVVIPMSIK